MPRSVLPTAQAAAARTGSRGRISSASRLSSIRGGSPASSAASSDGELAGGGAASAAPTVTPVWGRELLTARDPPRPSFPHREYDDEVPGTKGITDVEHRYIFFGPGELAAIRAHLAPPRLENVSNYTTYEALTGFLWKCRAMALALDADEEVRVLCAVSARRGSSKTAGIRVPRGYYGNTIVFPAAVSSAGDLCANPVGYAVELVRKAKGVVDAEYVRSVADLMALRGRPHFTPVRSFLLSDVTKFGFCDLDFGRGRAVYGGSPKVGAGVFPGVMSVVAYEDGIIVPVSLPGPSMNKFVEVMGKLLRARVDDIAAVARPHSAL